jgi:hypothetical protein
MLGDDNVLEKCKSADILHGKHIRIIQVAEKTSDKLPFRRIIYRGFSIIEIKCMKRPKMLKIMQKGISPNLALSEGAVLCSQRNKYLCAHLL